MLLKPRLLVRPLIIHNIAHHHQVYSSETMSQPEGKVYAKGTVDAKLQVSVRASM